MEEIYWEGWKAGWKEGWIKGWREGRKERWKEAADTARRMIADGSVPLPQIAEFSGLSLGEVESIRRSIDDGSVSVPSCTSRSPSVDSPSP